MSTKSEEKKSTRFYSKMQEEYVSALLNARTQPNSGAGLFRKGDVINYDASLLIECKTPTSEKESFSIKKEWLVKNKEEAFTQRVCDGVIAFTFSPGGHNFFVINEKLMTFLVNKLEEEYK